jgi:hypothetical protein
MFHGAVPNVRVQFICISQGVENLVCFGSAGAIEQHSAPLVPCLSVNTNPDIGMLRLGSVAIRERYLVCEALEE